MADEECPEIANQVYVKDASAFRRHEESGECSFPEVSENRKSTDVAYLFIFGICLIIWGGLVLRDWDIHFSSKKEYSETLEILESNKGNLTILCLIGTGSSIIALVLFRYFAKQFIWGSLITVLALLYLATGFMWHRDTQQGLAISFTVASVVFTICICRLYSRIKLSIYFFQLSIRYVFAMPLLLSVPPVVFTFSCMVLGLLVLMLTSTSGTQDGSFAVYWSAFMATWTLQFLWACQQMILAGGVAAFYFARDKFLLEAPIKNSVYNLLRYHLGTAAFGSITITGVRILTAMLRKLSRDSCWIALLYHCCIEPILKLLQYISSMAYIETALHGQSFCRSGIRAVKLICLNVLTAVALSSVGSFVFFMPKLVLVLLITATGVLMNLPTIVIVSGCIISFMFAHCCFVTFETAVDTVFLCYCEDMRANNGTTKPYLATAELHSRIKEVQILTEIEIERQK